MTDEIPAVLCEHANECPRTCPCPPNCYCRRVGSAPACRQATEVRPGVYVSGTSTSIFAGSDVGKSRRCQRPLSDTESHGWCMNSTPEESHCQCICHQLKISPLNAKLAEIEAGLIDNGFLHADGLQPHRPPKHGPCCTCQDCGWYHDDCVCDSNKHWEWWLKVKANG